MDDFSSAKFVLNIDKTKLNKDIEESKSSVLAAVVKINKQLKLKPINIQVRTEHDSDQSKSSFRQMVSDALEDLGYTVDAIRSNTERSSNNGYTNTAQVQPRDASGSSVIPVVKQVETSAANKGQSRSYQDRLRDQSAGRLSSGRSKYGAVVSGIEQTAQFFGAIDSKAQGLISTFNDFDNAISALASKTMSFADMLDLSQNNVSVGYFAQMTNQSATDVFHANNIGAGYSLKSPESMRQLQQWVDVNKQLRTDPQHVRYKEQLDSLAKIDPRVLQVTNEQGRNYTALERQSMIAEANSKLMQQGAEGREQAAQNAKVFGHNNQNIAAIYMDYTRYKGYHDEKSDQKWVDPITREESWITRSEYQARTITNSNDINDAHTRNQLAQNIAQNRAVNEKHSQFKSNLQYTNQQIHAADDSGLYGKVANQTFWNDQGRMWMNLYQAKGSLVGWGGMGSALGTMFPKINPITGEKVYTSDDLDPKAMQAYQAGTDEAIITTADQMGGANYGVMSFRTVNHKNNFQKKMNETLIDEKKEEIKQQRIEQAKQQGKSPVTIQDQISDKALTQAVQQEAIQKEIKVRLDALMQIYEAGKQHEITNQGELVKLVAKTAVAAGVTYAVPGSSMITAPWMVGEYAKYLASGTGSVSPEVLKKFADSKHQQTNMLPDFSLPGSPYNSGILNKNGHPNNVRSPQVNMPESQYQKLLHDFTFTDSRKIDSTVNVYANTNDPHAIGNIVQDKISMVMKKPAKPVGFPGSDYINAGVKGTPR